MKKKLIFSTQFKRDFKHYRNRPDFLQIINGVFQMLEYGIPLPPEMLPHKLVGNYRGCMECHVENDTLLIWVDEKNNTIRMLRLGSHSELF